MVGAFSAGDLPHFFIASRYGIGCAALKYRNVRPPRGRCLTDDAAKHLRQMRLVEQTTAKCNLAEREIGPQHDALSKFNAPTPEKSTGRNSERLLECAAKVAAAQTCESRKLSYGDSSSEARIDV